MPEQNNTSESAPLDDDDVAERPCTVLVAADPYNGDPCGEEAAGLRYEPTCGLHLDYLEVFRHERTWRADDDDGWDPIDDATVFLRERNVALDLLREATGRSMGDLLREVRETARSKAAEHAE